MSIKFEWKYGNNKGGIAKFKVGAKHHVLHLDSYDAAAKVYQLLMHAHAAGEAKGARSVEKERQRVADLLTIGG
jgi:hypothetical protein